ncbi:hypothetical protein VYU27_008134 [Nannochloropsis oceanica]
MGCATFLLLNALLLAATTVAQNVTYVMNTESCKEGTFSRIFTRVGRADSSCTLLPGLQHGTVECTGQNGEATGQLWGTINYKCSSDFLPPMGNFSLKPGCNVRIANTTLSVLLKGCPGEPKRALRRRG